MAKKKSKSGVPKRIAGVKVPKRLRRRLGGLLASPMGKAIVADAIVAAGTALAASQARKGSPTRRFVDEHPPGEMKDAAVNTGSTLAHALSEASRAFVAAMRQGRADADARTAWPAPEDGEVEARAARRKAAEAPAAAH